MNQLLLYELFYRLGGELIGSIGAKLGEDVVFCDIVVFDVGGLLDTEPYVFQPAGGENGEGWGE